MGLRREFLLGKRLTEATRALQRSIDLNDPAALDLAISKFETLLADASPDRQDYGVAVNNLSIARAIRYDRLGDLHDLDEAVRLRRTLLGLRGGGPFAGRCFSLATCLVTRFQRSGDPADLDEAVAAAQQAADVTPPDHEGRARFLSGLVHARLARYKHARDLGDLQGAHRAVLACVAVARPNDPDRGIYFNHLSDVENERYQAGAGADALDAAIAAARAARDAVSMSTYRNRAGRVPAATVRVQAWTERMKAENQQKLEHYARLRAELRGEKPPAASSVPESAPPTPTLEHPELAARLLNLANLLLARGIAADLSEALDGLQRATESIAAPAATRARAAHRRALTLAVAHGPAAALDAYEEAVALLPLLAWRGIGQRDQLHLLRMHASLGRDAAACAIADGKETRAVELLEQGRGLYWAQLLDTRTDLTALQHDAPDLAAELFRCREILDGQGAAASRHAAARTFDLLVERVRALPPSPELTHPQEFLRPPGIARLLPGGTVTLVVINVSQWRCDALLLTEDGVTLLPLSDLTAEEVAEVAGRHVENLERLEGGFADQTEVEALLDWLWRKIVEPVLKHLGHLSRPDDGKWPRLWWCPTGPLAALPLHAATPADGNDGALDRVVSSYTPTVRAFNHARSRQPSQRPARQLIATLSVTPGQSSLPSAAIERDILTGLLPSATVLENEQATQAALHQALPQHRWFHASCHGTQNLADPSAGGLLPYDWQTAGVLGVTDLAGVRHHDGEMAFLSACRTATGGTATPDEVITVAAAMQYAGWRHVVGTLWSIPDDVASSLTRGFYTRVVRDGQPQSEAAALALHQAVRRLRALDPERAEVWSAFAHLGP